MTSRPHWSYSSISQYLRCPLQFFFQRVLDLPSPTVSSNLALGGAVHAALAEYHRQLKDKEAINSETVLKTFLDSWDEREADEAILFRDGDTRESSIELGIHLVELYLKEPPPEGIIAIEKTFVVPLYNSQGEYLEKPLVAITDLITLREEGLKISEFKTSGRALSGSEAETSLQPTCYVHAVRECLGQEPNIEYTVLVKTKTPKVQRLQTTRYPEDCGRLGDLVQTIQKAVDLGIFYPVENPMNCSNCAYRSQCREWSQSSKTQGHPVGREVSGEVAACSPN